MDLPDKDFQLKLEPDIARQPWTSCAWIIPLPPTTRHKFGSQGVEGTHRGVEVCRVHACTR